jgi:hypothetical protein
MDEKPRIVAYKLIIDGCTEQPVEIRKHDMAEPKQTELMQQS